MLIQIDIWCSHKLASWIMSNYENDQWLNFIESSEEKRFVDTIKPKFKSSNTAIGQYGSLFPKLLYFYECKEEEFLIDEPQKTDSYKISAAEGLSPYYDFEIGYDARSVDRDDISPYPYLHIDSKDYFTTHNIETDYAGEELLRLIRRQLQNLNPSHCFMTQIRAYDKNFDICYQSINVMNPKALKEPPCDEPAVFEHTWLGKRDIGYSLADIEGEVSEIPDSWQFITRQRLAYLIEAGELDYSTVSNYEMHQSIEWLEHFDDKYLSLTYDLFCKFTGWKTAIEPKREVTLLTFDWDKN